MYVKFENSNWNLLKFTIQIETKDKINTQSETKDKIQYSIMYFLCFFYL